MAKTTKKKQPTPPKREPGLLLIDNRFMTKEEAQSLLDARQANPEKRDEINAAFNEKMGAKAMTMPEVRAASVIQRFEGDHLNINAQVDELRRLTGKVNGGDMTTPEAMLVAQAHTLDALFSNLAIRAHSNMNAGYLDASDRYMRLAFKAQAQAAKTIQILAEIKNPRPVAFVKQANIAHNQQINNGPAQENENQPSKLSEEGHELLENTRASSIEGGINQTLETLGALDGAAYARG